MSTSILAKIGRSVKIGSRSIKKIAVTGGIASGKTTVCRLFEELGAYYVSADEIVHQLLVPTTDLGQKVIALLGDDIVVGESLSRERIAQKVFDDPQLLRTFEKWIHPEVQRVIDSKYKTISPQKYPLFVAEVPLLFEAHLEGHYDLVIVVKGEEKVCRERFDQQFKGEYTRRTQRLMPIEEKIQKAAVVIDNNGTLENLRQNIQPLFIALKENL